MKNNSLNNAFPIVAAALGNKFGINVRVGGQDAYTDGKSINIPAYNLDDPSYKDVAWGYIAHEAAHIRFTDFVDFSNAATSPIRKNMLNILEDIRIEKLIQETYPGTKRTTEKVVIHLVQTGDFQVVGQNEQVHPATILSHFLLFRLRNDILKQTALASYADTAESLLEETFPAGAVTRLAGLLSEVPQLQVTRDCVRLADRILRMIEEEQEKEQEKALQQQQTTQSQRQDSHDSSSPSQTGQGDTDQDEDSTDTDAGDPKKESPFQGEDPQTDQDTDEDEESKPGKGGNHPTGSSAELLEDQDSEKLAQILSSVLSAGADDIPDDMFEVAQQLLASQPGGSYDRAVHLPIAMAPDRNPSIGNALMNKVLTESGKIRASLQGLVQSSRCDRSVNKRSGNRIDGRKLSRLMQGDSRVFDRRSHKQAPNTAIHLLVDGSGSMHRFITDQFRQIDLAMESALALALALEGISGVNPAVTRFPYEDTYDVVPLLRHGQKIRPNVSAFSSITCGGTPLDTALWYAASSVLATRENRKIIMVLTDGEPDDIPAAKAIIQRCEATGIELVGVGICYDTRHLFDRSICINNVSELRTELFKISRDLLLAA